MVVTCLVVKDIDHYTLYEDSPTIKSRLNSIKLNIININGETDYKKIRNLSNLPYIEPVTNDAQTEFNFERKVRYEEIMEAIDKLENKIIILTNKINELSTIVDKKKPKKNLDDGPQAG